MTSPQYCFCFVCQRGHLEVQALFLSASLARNVRASYEMIGAVPIEYGVLEDVSLEILESLGVKIVHITNPIDKTYLIGNKLSCLEAAHEMTDAQYTVFLDTDMLCDREFYGIEGIEHYDISMRIAGLARWWANDEEWEPLYSLFNLQLPKARMVSVTSQEQMPPYFNSGLIAIPKNSPLPAKWIEVAQVIYNQLRDEGKKKKNVDQVSLSIAIEALGLRYQSLDTKYNSTPWSKEEAIFIHYHSFDKLFHDYPEKVFLLSSISKQYPVLEDMVNQYSAYSLKSVLG